MENEKELTKLEYIKRLTSERLKNIVADTPAIHQYIQAKKDQPDAVVLFRMGDFYETFFDDAVIVSKELEITLTSRGKNQNNVPLAGIPYHALDNYLGKLVEAGYKVAICEQLEDPKLAKGVVKRGITRVITPGTKPSDLVNSNTNNYIMSIYQSSDFFAMAVADLTTKDCHSTILNYSNLINEMVKYNPSEIIMPESLRLNEELLNDMRKLKLFVNPIDNSNFCSDDCNLQIISKCIKSELGKIDLDIPDKLKENLMIYALSGLANYSKKLGIDMNIADNVRIYSVNNYMVLDMISLRNLELLYNNYDHSANHTLFSALNRTKTSMGLRLLKNTILRPLIDIRAINERLDAVEELKNNLLIRERLKQLLKEINDIERLGVKLSLKTILPRELTALKKSLQKISEIGSELGKLKSRLIEQINDFKNTAEIIAIIEQSIDDSYNYTLSDRGYIKQGHNSELDELRLLLNSSKDMLIGIEQKEKEKTRIQSLRISYNKVIGYHITVSNSNLKYVPDYFIRKQTLVNGERFITPELKDLEEKILDAEQNIDQVELTLYNKIIDALQQYCGDLLNTSKNIAYLDVLLSFSETAYLFNYSKPKLNEAASLEIINGRHPVIEQIEPNFSPNNLVMDNNNYVHIITGPNMSGKSTFMRQCAMIHIMAQIGCFVPCDEASLPVVDRIFTRIGASDYLSRGESTFMVEMLETANIINNATERSFIILDEIGRGTSTFDGIAIAQSVIEHIATKIKAKTLFATHYHQLNKLAQQYPQIHNYNVLVKDDSDKIIFLHKIVGGGTDKSYGIHVAKLAGLPDEIIEKSKRIISKLEMTNNISQVFDDLNDKNKDLRDNISKSKQDKDNKKIVQSLLEY